MSATKYGPRYCRLLGNRPADPVQIPRWVGAAPGGQGTAFNTSNPLSAELNPRATETSASRPPRPSSSGTGSPPRRKPSRTRPLSPWSVSLASVPGTLWWNLTTGKQDREGRQMLCDRDPVLPHLDRSRTRLSHCNCHQPQSVSTSCFLSQVG